jgi:hypothetical protein
MIAFKIAYHADETVIKNMYVLYLLVMQLRLIKGCRTIFHKDQASQ